MYAYNIGSLIVNYSHCKRLFTYRIVGMLAATFAVFIFAEADLSVKTAKFCTTRKFPAIRYIMTKVVPALSVQSQLL